MTDKSSISHNIMSEPENNREQKAFISIVTPAFNEEKNLPMLYPDLRSVLDRISNKWEWVVIDDHSTDETFGVLEHLAAQDDRIRGGFVAFGCLETMELIWLLHVVSIMR